MVKGKLKQQRVPGVMSEGQSLSRLDLLCGAAAPPSAATESQGCRQLLGSLSAEAGARPRLARSACMVLGRGCGISHGITAAVESSYMTAAWVGSHEVSCRGRSSPDTEANSCRGAQTRICAP